MSHPFFDMTPECGVEIHIRHDGKVVWISIDGSTVLRINDTPIIDIIDDRVKEVRNTEQTVQAKVLKTRQDKERGELRSKHKQERKALRREFEQQNEGVES